MFKLFGSLIRIVTFYACIWVVGLIYFVSLIPATESIPTGEYDAIIALTGGEQRMEHAIELLALEKAPQLFISGVYNKFRLSNLQKNISTDLEQRIFFGKVASSTVENAYETQAWLSDKPSIQRLLLVTANYHMPRSRLLFDHIIASHHIAYAPVDPPLFMLDDWVNHDNSRRLVLSEYHKWVVTMLQVHLLGLR